MVPGRNWQDNIFPYHVSNYLLLSHFSRVRLFATPWTAAYQAPPSMGFSRQEYWNGLPLPSPEQLPTFPLFPFVFFPVTYNMHS